MKFEVNEKVYAFTMLLFGQQLFLQMFDKGGKLDDSEFGLIKPIMILNIVDFPTPLGPSNPKISPLFNLKFKSSKIFLLPKKTETF